MLGSARHPADVAKRQRMALENSIRRIEAAYQMAERQAAQDRSPPLVQRAPPPPQSRQLEDSPRQAGRPRIGGLLREPPPQRQSAPPPLVEPRRAPAPAAPSVFHERRSAFDDRLESPEYDDDLIPGERRETHDRYRDDPPPYLDPADGRDHDARDPAAPDYFGDDDFSYPAGDPPPLRRRRTGVLRLIIALVVLAALGVGGWFLYGTAMSYYLDARDAPPAAAETASEADANAKFITILAPNDTAGLRTSGRGKAEIVSQGNVDMIRLESLRQPGARSQPSSPILIEIGEGALREIAGHRVTVEIQAKSGSDAKATFAVGCLFDDQDSCGRKRFLVGSQPEAILFKLDIPQSLSQGGKAFLTLNTDVTSNSSVTGGGDVIDVVYARLRYDEG